MESIRARYASRINGTYTNEQQTDIFKQLGLYNNDSSSLADSNNAPTGAAAFMAKRDPAAEEKLHHYRHEAWNEANFNATHVKEYTDVNPAGYVVEPLPIPAATPPPAFIAKGIKAGRAPPASFVAK